MIKEDRRIQKTKAAITEALLSLLEEKDFGQITIHEIAERANVNRGTIYFHYEDKFALLSRIIDQKLDQLKNVCERITLESTPEELTKYFEAVYSFFADNRKFFTLMLSRADTSQFRTKFKALMLSEMRRDTMQSSTTYDKEFAEQFKVNALVGIVEWWIHEDYHLSVEKMALNTVTLFMRNR